MKKYDVIVIGGGPAGYSAAERLAELKKSVCIVETDENRVGGTCLNEGCIPVKSLLEAAEVYDNVKNAFRFGISAKAEPPDMKKIRGFAEKNVLHLRSSLFSFLKGRGVDFVFGRASFTSKHEIEVAKEKGGSEKLEADYFVIATGSKAKELPALAPDGKYICNSSELLKTGLPADKILIVGGGYIGCEFATFYSRMDSKVTVVEMREQILPGEDGDVARALSGELAKSGVEIFTEGEIVSAAKKGSKIETVIKLRGKADEKVFEFDRALVCAGRVPDISGLALEKIGVETEKGFIKVDKQMKTSVPNVYAAGDVVNTPLLASVAYGEGKAAAESIAGFEGSPFDYSAVPRVVFTSPQVGCIGMTEKEAKQKGLEVKIIRKFFKANAKAFITGRNAGFAKIIFDEKSHRLLGAAMLGPFAGELIHLLSRAVLEKITVEKALDIIYAHPTLSEILKNG
ncbi:MAG: dihydrolipoyl dehydrogenase [bacterium]